MKKLVVSFAMTWAAAAWACDDGSPVTSIVGTLDGDRLLVREERFEGARIDLYVLDLAKNKVTEFASIVELRDAEEDRPKLRAARWKDAEAKLKKQGLTLKPLALQALPLELQGVTLATRPGAKGKCAVVELTAGGKTVDSLRSCEPSDGFSYAGVVVTPDGRFVVPMIKAVCLDAPTRWMKAVPVASFPAPAPR